ncbi:MAG: hypothetical protein Kow00105_18780 [Phycisphaeraceae bacterium]
MTGKIASLLSVLTATAISATATATPIYDTFGPLDDATFGGQGIPNDEVAVSSQIVDGNVTLIVAMSATQRYSNPPLTNDGAGTYFATPGSNFGGNNESAFEGALWNFNYYMKVVGSNGATPKLTDYQIDLYYDFDTGFDTPVGSLGRINVTNALLGQDPNATLVEDSQNLMFNFLTQPVPGVVFPPAGSFDPNALGEYNFAITVSGGGLGIETVAMDVQVIPEPGSIALMSLGGLLILKRRQA